MAGLVIYDSFHVLEVKIMIRISFFLAAFFFKTILFPVGSVFAETSSGERLEVFKNSKISLGVSSWFSSGETHDDLLATGGTVSACVELCEGAGAEVVGSLSVIELVGLGARGRLDPVSVHALVEFPA